MKFNGDDIIDVIPPEVIVRLMLTGCLIDDRQRGDLNADSRKEWKEAGFPFSGALDFVHGDVRCRVCGGTLKDRQRWAAQAHRDIETGLKNIAVGYAYDILRIHKIPFNKRKAGAWRRKATGRGDADA